MRHPARCLKHPVTKPNSPDQLERERENDNNQTSPWCLVLGVQCVLCEDEMPEPIHYISKQGCKSRVSNLMLEKKKSQSLKNKLQSNYQLVRSAPVNESSAVGLLKTTLLGCAKLIFLTQHPLIEGFYFL
jgi:hypothetical protein